MPIPRTARVLFPLALISWVAAPAGLAKEVQLQEVQCQTQPGGVTVRIILSHATDYKEGTLPNPDRLFLDFTEARIEDQVLRCQNVDSDLIWAVRAAQNSNDPPVARVVIDLKEAIQPRIRAMARGRIILVEFGKGGLRPPVSPSPASAVQVTGITIEPNQDGISQAIIESTGQAHFRDFILFNPLRVVVDLKDAELKVEEIPVPSDDPLLQRIRVGQFDSDTVRVVLDLKEAASYDIRRRSNPDGLSVELRPGMASGKVVVIDAGHGGKDPGALGYKVGLREKDIVLDIALRVAALLRQAGLIPLMTRSDDRFVELADRVRFANGRRADLFVSVHCNAMPLAKRGRRCGIEVYYYTPQSEPLASAMQDALVRTTGRPDNGVRRRGFYVIRHSVMPSVLTEVGYLDHATEGELLSTPDFRQTVAQSIVKGIQQYLKLQPRVLG